VERTGAGRTGRRPGAGPGGDAARAPQGVPWPRGRLLPAYFARPRTTDPGGGAPPGPGRPAVRSRGAAGARAGPAAGPATNRSRVRARR